eukprot:COSAG01_NODE_5852_length_3992_cov_9.319805_3_plen_60_part_00
MTLAEPIYRHPVRQLAAPVCGLYECWLIYVRPGRGWRAWRRLGVPALAAPASAAHVSLR